MDEANVNTDSQQRRQVPANWHLHDWPSLQPESGDRFVNARVIEKSDCLFMTIEEIDFLQETNP
jgi:hypothetical protein